MELTKDVVLAHAQKPEFRSMIDLLIDKGLLAARWTLEDLVEALSTLANRYEMVDMFGGPADGSAMEEALFQRHLIRCDKATKKKEAWRENPDNLERERSQDKQRRAKKRKRLETQLASERLAYLRALSQQARAARKAKIAHETPPPPPPVPAVASQWKKLPNLRRAKDNHHKRDLGIAATA